MPELYYTAPTDEAFEEVKIAAMSLWLTRYPADKNPFYAEEKVARIKDIQNVKDNMMYIIAMFDSENQTILANVLSMPTREAIRDRMIDGGTPESYIPF